MRHLSEIYDLRFGGCGMSRTEAAAWLGVTVRTLQRHEHAPNPSHGPIYRALRLRAGYLEDIDPAWLGWTLKGDRVFWPGDRYGLTAGQIMAMTFDRQRLRLLERQLRQLREEHGIAIAGTPAKDGRFAVTLPVMKPAETTEWEAEKEPKQRAQLVPIAPFLKEGTK